MSERFKTVAVGRFASLATPSTNLLRLENLKAAIDMLQNIPEDYRVPLEIQLGTSDKIEATFVLTPITVPTADVPRCREDCPCLAEKDLGDVET